MSYIFPKRRLEKGDILDPLDLNADIIPAAERYSGRINEHNISSSVKGYLTDTSPATGQQDLVASDAYIKPYSVYTYVTFSRGSEGSWVTPVGRASDSFPSDAYVVPNDFSWNRVADTFISDSSLTTGVSNLWITAWLQYIWFEWNYDAAPGIAHVHPSGEHRNVALSPIYEDPSERPCRIQFAIRVDGVVIESTITGTQHPFDLTLLPVQYDNERNYGPHTPKREQCTGLGAIMLPVRIGATVPVQPGKHIVELVARRIEPSINLATDVSDDSDEEVNAYFYDDFDYVVVGNRRLMVLDMPTHPPSSSEFSSADPGAFQSEHTVTTASLGRDKVYTVRDAYNSVESGALGRGALNNNHLPPAVLNSDMVTLTHSGGVGIQAGRDTGGLITEDIGGTGWFLVQDATIGTPNKLQLAPSTAYDLTSRTSFLIVMANVQVLGVRPHSPRAQQSSLQWGHFALGYIMPDGNHVVIGETEAMVCNHSNWGPKTQYIADTLDTLVVGSEMRRKFIDEDVDVPLFWTLDMSSLPSGFDIAKLGVYASTSTSAGPGEGGESEEKPTVFTTRGSLILIQLRV